MSDEPREVLNRMETMLRRCRRRLLVAEVSVRMRKGLAFFLAGFLGIAGIFLILRTLAWAPRLRNLP